MDLLHYRINPSTATKGRCMASRYGGGTTSSQSLGGSMSAIYGEKSTSRMVMKDMKMSEIKSSKEQPED